MPSRLPFTSALITGASSGIGEAMVLELAKSGIPMVLVARRGDRLQALADQYGNCEVFVADLGDPAATERVAARIASVDAPIDLVVNNAGFGTTGLFHQLDEDRLQREIALNVAALTRLSHASLATMVPRGRGYLLNVSSVVSFQSAPKLAVYAATKAYVTSLSEALHEEARGTGVHVTALCPGLTRTEFSDVSSGGEAAASYPDFAWMDAATVAVAGLRAVAAGRALEIPGLMNKALVSASSAAPRRLVRRAGSALQSKVR